MPGPAVLLEGRRRTNEEAQFLADAMAFRLGRDRDNGHHEQRGQSVERGSNGVAVQPNADLAAS